MKYYFSPCRPDKKCAGSPDEPATVITPPPSAVRDPSLSTRPTQTVATPEKEPPAPSLVDRPAAGESTDARASPTSQPENIDEPVVAQPEDVGEPEANLPEKLEPTEAPEPEKVEEPEVPQKPTVRHIVCSAYLCPVMRPHPALGHKILMGRDCLYMFTVYPFSTYLMLGLINTRCKRGNSYLHVCLQRSISHQTVM